MKMYQIFLVGYGGRLESANGVLPYFLNYASEDTAFYDLQSWFDGDKINKKLTYVVLPVFVHI